MQRMSNVVGMGLVLNRFLPRSCTCSSAWFAWIPSVVPCNSMEQFILCFLNTSLKIEPVVFWRCLFLFLQEEGCLKWWPQINFLSLSAAGARSFSSLRRVKKWRSAKKAQGQANVGEIPAFARNLTSVVPNPCLPEHTSSCPSGQRKITFKL